MRVGTVSLLGIVVSLLVVTACGSPAPGTDASAGASALPASFTAPTLAGATFDASSLAGKPALLWFWAPWCSSCAGQAETVRGLADAHQGKVSVVGVAGMGTLDEMKDFVEKFEVGNMTHLADEQGAVYRRFEITQQSTFALIDASGKVLGTGPLDDDELTERVEALAAG